MNRDMILEAAAQIFSEKGFHAASMQDIAQAVSLQKGSLYHHVASKQEILLEILDRALDLLTERLLTALAEGRTPAEKLRLAARSYVETLAEFRGPASVLLLEYRSLEPQYQARHILKRDRFENLWREMIIEGSISGEFQVVDPAMASRAILGAMNWAITWYRPDGKLTARQIADHFSSLFLNGLQVRNET